MRRKQLVVSAVYLLIAVACVIAVFVLPPMSHPFVCRSTIDHDISVQVTMSDAANSAQFTATEHLYPQSGCLLSQGMTWYPATVTVRIGPYVDGQPLSTPDPLQVTIVPKLKPGHAGEVLVTITDEHHAVVSWDPAR